MNIKHRSLVLGAALCGAWLWTGPAHAQLVGGTLGGGVSGSLLGGPANVARGDLRMDASGSLHANPGELRTTAAEARREAGERSRAARERVNAAGSQVADETRSTAAAVTAPDVVLEAAASGRLDASPASMGDGAAQFDHKDRGATASDEPAGARPNKTSERAKASSAQGPRSKRQAAAGAGAERSAS